MCTNNKSKIVVIGKLSRLWVLFMRVACSQLRFDGRLKILEANNRNPETLILFSFYCFSFFVVFRFCGRFVGGFSVFTIFILRKQIASNVLPLVPHALAFVCMYVFILFFYFCYAEICHTLHKSLCHLNSMLSKPIWWWRNSTAASHTCTQLFIFICRKGLQLN